LRADSARLPTSGAGVAKLCQRCLELAQDVLGLLAPSGHEPADQLLGVAARHAAAADGVIDHVLEAVAGDGDALLEGLAEGLHALSGLGRLLLRSPGSSRGRWALLPSNGQSTRASQA
jgi:hypothetical protein